jgi:CBS domain containing-hemolysin-like protein
MGTTTLILCLLVLALTLSFVLSGMEAGVFALSRLRIRRQVRAGKQSARLLYGYLENPENFLWTILVGNTVANFFILGWTVAVLQGALAQQRLLFVAAFSIIVFFFYAFFDLLPKTLFRQYPNRLCMALARPFRLIHLVLRPLVWLVEWASSVLLRWTGGKTFTGHLFGNREELRLVMQESAQAFSSEERVMINRVLDLQSLSVRQIMTPIEKAVTITSQMPVREVLALARERHFTRYPVWETRDGQRRIIGLLSLNTLLFLPEMDTTKPAAEFVKPALYLDEDLRVEVALRRMQRGGQRLAVVLGRDRKEIGIVGLEDVLKVIFGEMSL